MFGHDRDKDMCVILMAALGELQAQKKITKEEVHDILVTKTAQMKTGGLAAREALEPMRIGIEKALGL